MSYVPPTVAHLESLHNAAAEARRALDGATRARDAALARRYEEIEGAHSPDHYRLAPSGARERAIAPLRDAALADATREFHDSVVPHVRVLLDSGDELRAAETYYESDIANLERATFFHPARASAAALLSSAGPAQLRSVVEAAREQRARDPEAARAAAMAAVSRLQQLSVPAGARPFDVEAVLAEFQPDSTKTARDLIGRAKGFTAGALQIWRSQARPPLPERSGPTSVGKISRGLAELAGGK